MTVNGVLFEDDILQNIFAFLDGESLIKANCCCKNWSTFLKKPSVRVALSSKFQELPLHIDPVNGDDNSTSGSCVWPFKTIERAEQWMENFQGTRKKPKCSGLFRPFLLPSAFDFKEVRFHCNGNNAKCDILPCSVGGRLACGGKVCSEHGIGWGRWIRDSVTGHFYICFDSDAFVCQMVSFNKKVIFLLLIIVVSSQTNTYQMLSLSAKEQRVKGTFQRCFGNVMCAREAQNTRRYATRTPSSVCDT